MKRLAKKAVKVSARMLVKAGLLPEETILSMDGGICSQMHFLLVGRMLEEKGNKVSYNLDWFKHVGSDLDGRFCRNFDLLKLFPSLSIATADNSLIKRVYKTAFYFRNDYFDNEAKATSWLDLKSPLWLEGYFHDPDEMYSRFFDEAFVVDTDVLPADNLPMLSAIEDTEGKCDSCSVHVRRGDLAKYNSAYGYPVPTDYFVEACRQVSMHSRRKVRFFLFSDEADWCEKELLPLLTDYDVTICDINGSDRGWCDLVLMSRCRHQVTSHGSMGKYAALLRPVQLRNGLVTLPQALTTPEWEGRFKNSTVVRMTSSY